MSWAEQAIQELEDHPGADSSRDGDVTVVGIDGLGALKGELLALRLVHSVKQRAPREVAEMARRALELLPEGKERHLMGLLRLIGAIAHATLGDFRSAEATLNAAVDEARRARDPAQLAGALEHRADLSVVRGQLQDAEGLYEEALRIAQEASAEARWLMCGPHASLAELFLERADLPKAQEHSARAIECASTSPTRSYVLYARAAAVRVLLAAGNRDAALLQLVQAEAFARGSRDNRFSSFLSGLQLEFYCRDGELDRAAYVARGRGLTPVTPADAGNARELSAYARYLLLSGTSEDAEQVLSRLLPLAHDGGQVQQEIHVLALHAWALEALGDRMRALESLGRATELGEAGRFTRTFTAEGAVLVGLLHALLDAVRRGNPPAEVGSVSYLGSLVEHAGGAAPQPSPFPDAATALPQRLTARELEILRLVATGMMNQEIADRLVISLPTVKRHLANAYGKLDVGHRTEAVARMHELSLL